MTITDIKHAYNKLEICVVLDKTKELSLLSSSSDDNLNTQSQNKRNLLQRLI